MIKYCCACLWLGMTNPASVSAELRLFDAQVHLHNDEASLEEYRQQTDAAGLRAE